eukprot:INCI6750.3.p1 GENE.INCI6750.3~~INCI6750.3.p1  ORF type:complete len:504 (-),score=126.29 INCI6750.3:339-1850(-)
MLAMTDSDDEDDVEREYTVADLKQRPKSYKALSALTGVTLAQLKKMGKREMRQLPVRHYNFDTSIFKQSATTNTNTGRERSASTQAQAKKPTDGWNMSDDDDVGSDSDSNDNDGDDDSHVATGRGARATTTSTTTGLDPFSMLSARAAEREAAWNAPHSAASAPASSISHSRNDPLSSAFSSEAMAQTPDIEVTVKPRPKADARSTRPMQQISAAEAATRATTTPPNTAAAISRARSKAGVSATAPKVSSASGDQSVATAAADAAAEGSASNEGGTALKLPASASGPSSVVAIVDEGLKQRVKKREKRVRAMLNHELIKVQSRTKRLIRAKKQLDNLARSSEERVKELRQGIEISTANICKLEKAHAYAKKQYEAADKEMNTTRDKKTKLIQHLSMILSENEARKEQKLLELKSALDATILNAGNEVTQLVATARKRLDDALPKTVRVARCEDVRVNAKQGQVVAWMFEVEGGLDINFSAEFFRGKSALSFSVTVAERLGTVG